MGFARAVRTCLTKFGEFTGRASRSEFWWFSLFQFLAMFALVAFDFVRILPMLEEDSTAVATLGAFWYATTWGWIFFLLPVWAASVRRLHDTDRSGLWLLLHFVPFGSLVLFIFFLLPGSRYRNTFGPPPGSEGAEAAARAALMPEPVSRDALQADLRALRQSRMQGTA